MNAKYFFFAIAIMPAFISALSGCSKTTKEAAPLPEIISKVYFPYIKDSALYSFDPVSGESEKLVESELDLFLALDVDESNQETDDDDNIIFSNTIAAEYFVFANKQTLHIYDPYTRREHLIFSFKDDSIFVEEDQGLFPAPESYICDIQKVVTLDENARLGEKILYKDELKVYVKTSLNNECIETSQNYSYWQIDILESQEDPYTLRRKMLLEHTHKHTHFHDHDDPNYELAAEHDHPHTLKAGEKDPNNNNLPFDPNNHEHSHSHTHDFIYPADHFHEYLTKEDVDNVHESLVNQQINFETYPILIGRKSSINSIDEALMYSGKPIVDINNQNFGYLGLNSVDNSYKFYSVNLESLDKKLLWELKSDHFQNLTNTPKTLSTLERITPKYNRPANFDYINQNILIEANNNLFYFTLAELFDDDEAEARESRLISPLFNSYDTSSNIKNRYTYNPANKNMTIIEGLKLLTIEISGDDPGLVTAIKEFQENDLTTIDALDLSANFMVVKTFTTNNKTETSVISLLGNGLENQTIIPRSEINIFINHLDSNLNAFLNINDLSNNTLSARFYNNIYSNSLDILYETLWTADSVDYRNNLQTETSSLLSSDTSSISPDTIDSPKLYLFNTDATPRRGEEFGKIPQEVKGTNKMVVFNDLYGAIEVTNIDETMSTYFFSNEKTSFNFNNEFKIMKELK